MPNSKPERTCVVCRKKGSKENFIKIVKNKNGEVLIEKDIKLSGRGAYICKDEKCLQNCSKSKALNRTFKINIPLDVYEELKNWNN